LKYSIRLLRIVGIDIGVHYTWLFIFSLVTWSLAEGYFPQVYEGWETSTYWIAGVVGGLMLFVSVLLHELAHSLVARARGMSVSSITLFLFGGVSNLAEEPKKPSIEFFMSILGPASSLALAGVFWGLFQLVGDDESPPAAVLAYLALINALLAAFNLLPGFPLDGGRVLRSIIWGYNRQSGKVNQYCRHHRAVIRLGPRLFRPIAAVSRCLSGRYLDYLHRLVPE